VSIRPDDLGGRDFDPDPTAVGPELEPPDDFAVVREALDDLYHYTGQIARRGGRSEVHSEGWAALSRIEARVRKLERIEMRQEREG